MTRTAKTSQSFFIYFSACRDFCSLHPSNWIWFAAWAVLTAGVVKPYRRLPDYRRLFNGRRRSSCRPLWLVSFAALLLCGPYCMFHCSAQMDARGKAHMANNRFIWPLGASSGPPVPCGAVLTVQTRHCDIDFRRMLGSSLSHCIFQQLCGQLYIHIGLKLEFKTCGIPPLYQESG